MISQSTRREAAALIAKGRTREAANLYRRALRRGQRPLDADHERLLLALYGVMKVTP